MRCQWPDRDAHSRACRCAGALGSRLPLGVTVNFTSHAAKLLVQTVHNPRSLMIIARLNRSVEIEVSRCPS
jgi:hypothetical protein